MIRRLICTGWVTLAIAVLALVAFGKAHVNSLPVTLIVIAGISGLVGLIASLLPTTRSRS